MRDPWRRKLDNLNARRGGFGRLVEPVRAARQPRHERTGPWGGKPRRSMFPIMLGVGIVFGFAAPVAVHHAGVLDLRTPTISSATAAGTPVPTAAPRVAARAIPVCSGKRRVTCIVDGDTGWHEGEKWRLISRSGGVDAPEISKPECATEGTAGDRATRRLQGLMSSGYTLSGGDYDRYERRLVTVTLADGRDAGEVLIDEGLAQDWPNSGNVWCGR